MQDGERREGRSGLLEGGKEGHKMCCECVSVLIPLCASPFPAAVIKAATLQETIIMEADKISETVLDHKKGDTLKFIPSM